MNPVGNVLAGFLFLHTRMSLMAKQEYEPTPEQIRAECALIRAERLAATAELPAPQQDEPQVRKKPSYRRYS